MKEKNQTNLVFQKTPRLGCGKTKGMAWKPKRSSPTQWDAAGADTRFESRIPGISLEDLSTCHQHQVVQIHQPFWDRLLSARIIYLKTLTPLSFLDFAEKFLTPVILHGFVFLLQHGQSNPNRPIFTLLHLTRLDSTRLQLGTAPLGSSARAVQYLKPQLLSACNVACNLSAMCAICLARNRKVMLRARS